MCIRDRIKVVLPENISDLLINRNKDYVTLVTCTPYGINSHRLLVRGERVPYKEEMCIRDRVDSASKGIKIKMIDLASSSQNASLINGNTSISLGGGYGNGTIKKNLLERRLGTDGYPIAKNGAKSLSGLFSGAPETNNLFIKSIYANTGYYEYSSFENYAYLDTSSSGSKKDFKVYTQIGTPTNEDKYLYKRGNCMPYNSISAGRFATNKNVYDEDGKSLTDTAPRKEEMCIIYRTEMTDDLLIARLIFILFHKSSGTRKSNLVNVFIYFLFRHTDTIIDKSECLIGRVNTNFYLILLIICLFKLTHNSKLLKLCNRIASVAH